MNTGTIDYTLDRGLAVLTINQPARLNAMSFDMWASLPALVQRADEENDARAIVLTGAGERAFCAGADISQFDDKRSGVDAVATYEQAVSCAMRALVDARKPVIALISGICFGGGLALALSCDIRLASSLARFRVPAARLGLGYAFANVEAMVARIGLAAAADVLLSARIFDAGEAQRIGLINKAWPEDQFLIESAAYLRMIAGNAPLTLQALKKSLSELTHPLSARDVAGADALVARCFASADYVEGQAAFKEKRDPQFSGR